MCEEEVGVFETKAEELMADALRLSRENDAAMKLPQPSGSIHQLMQLALMSFVDVAQVLIIVLHHDDNHAGPPYAKG